MISDKDWKLLKNNLPNWQERYMERLVNKYIDLLSDKEKYASEKFWTLSKKINNDKKKYGIQVSLRRSNVEYILIELLNEKVITMEDLSCFSAELKDNINKMIDTKI